MCSAALYSSAGSAKSATLLGESAPSRKRFKPARRGYYSVEYETYLQRAVDHLRDQWGHPAPSDLAHLSPLGWEHINLTGDYHWDTAPALGPDEFRPLRTRAHDFAAAA